MAAGRWRTALLLALLIDVGSPRFALAQSSPAPLQVPGRVLVHIESPEPVDLERGTGDFSDPFYVICTSPCDTWVPATDGYRIAGGGTRASRRFELLANAGSETLAVSPSSSTAFGIGIAAIVLGAVAASIGALGWLSDGFVDDPNGSSGNVVPLDLALGLVAGGLVAEAGGIVLVVLNPGSRVHQTTAFDPSAKSSSGLFPSDVAHRAAPIPGYPSATSWPLLRLAF